MTKNQKVLDHLLKEIANSEGCTYQSALRDILTDLWKIAENRGLDMQVALDGAEEVFDEENDLVIEDEGIVVDEEQTTQTRRNAVIQFAISYLMANLNHAIETSNVPLRPTLDELDLIYQEFVPKE